MRYRNGNASGGSAAAATVLVLAGLVLAPACGLPAARAQARAQAQAAKGAAYAPGLGELMAASQMRHLKLWYAGRAGNWPLARYEVDELEEGFGDAMRFHPTHKSARRPLRELIPEFMDGPVAALREAIAARDGARFVRAHDALTQSCNACHVATGFSFNRVSRPAGNPYTNQVFEPQR